MPLNISNRTTPSQEKFWASEGFLPEEYGVLAQAGALYNVKHSRSAGEIILTYLREKGHVPYDLTFKGWYDGTLIANNPKGFRVAVIGSYRDDGAFLLRGIVKEKGKGKPFNWLLNGQANTGAVQIKHIAEQDQVPFPEIQEVQRRFREVIEAKSRRMS